MDSYKRRSIITQIKWFFNDFSGFIGLGIFAFGIISLIFVFHLVLK
jgi:hypothetical protein